jgi:hypothetical protein
MNRSSGTTARNPQVTFDRKPPCLWHRHAPERATLVERRKVCHPLLHHPPETEFPQFGVSGNSLQLRSRLTTLVLLGDGSDAPGRPCVTCTIHSAECTYDDHPKVRLPDPGPFPSHHLTKSQPSRRRGCVDPFAAFQGLIFL